MTSIDPNNFRIVISQVKISVNAILSFVVKEVCPDKIPEKNTYIIKVQGIEMNNLTTVDKVKIEDGVWQFSVDLCPIIPALIPGVPCEASGNTLEVEGTANMLVAGSGEYDGFYTLTCIGDFMSIFAKNGINLIDECKQELTGYYCRVVHSLNKVLYERVGGGNKYIIFFYAPKGKWYIKQVVKNGVQVNNIFYEQEEQGSPEEVPLTGWKAYISSVTCSKSCPPCNPDKLSLQPCIPFDDNTSNLILVNCSGFDAANGCYYKDAANSRFVNVRDPNLMIRYVLEQKTALACWIIMDASTQVDGNHASQIYKSPSVRPSGSGSCNACVPCCGWQKICQTPGDPPQVTALDYYNLINPRHNMSYSSSNGGGWSLFDGFTEVGQGLSDHHIVVRTDSTAPVVDGAYCLTCVVPNNPPAFTKVLDTKILLEYNAPLTRWEIKNGGVVLFVSDSTNPVVPPFDGWTKVGPVDGGLPLVLNTILPSSINWVLL